MQIDYNFPGGNIVFERVDGDTFYLHHDMRDSKGSWIYWYFRVRGAAGRKLTFVFTKNDVIGVHGPAVSLDGGSTWSWLGLDKLKDVSRCQFYYEFPCDADEVRFSFAMPYLESNLRSFLQAYNNHPGLKIEPLCKTTKGRVVECLRLGKINSKSPYCILLACRHHCCEMMASYSLEGVMETILSDSDDGRWFQKYAEVLVVPFVDKDGVEEGDQGKNRRPHDHCRDYAGKSIYPSIAAIRDFIPQWIGDRTGLAMDMHCPGIKGNGNEDIYFVGSKNQAHWKAALAFSKILESIQSGELLFRGSNNLPFGKAWNNPGNYADGKTFQAWASDVPGMIMVTAIEIPYANASGTIVTADSARKFGHDLGRAIRIFLQDYEKNGLPALIS